ncbi:MAG: polysaccharide deacetylase family protein [Acidobacteriaceae bacterium]
MITGFAAGAYAYAAQWPTSQIFGRTVLAGADIHEVALTFDDGPNDPYTLELLELLARHQVRAIFFLIGDFVRRRPDIARAVRQAGHLVGNHTMSHPSLMWERPARVREELAGCTAAIEDATGEAVKYFRPPFGARRPDVLRSARELGLTPVMWNITAHDWDATDAEALAARVQRGIQSNQRRRRASSVLLHDGGHRALGTDRSVTLAATRMLLDSWVGSGLRVVTVDAWG